MAVASSTSVLRSTAFGTKRVHQRLSAGRAITLCWIAKPPSSSRLTISALAGAPSKAQLGRPTSIDLDAGRLPTNAIA